MSLKKLKHGLWQLRVTYIDQQGRERDLRRRFSGGFAEAKLMHQELLDLRDRGELGKAMAEAKAAVWDDSKPNLTMKEFAAEWLREYALPEMKPSSYQSAEGHLRIHVLPKLGHRQLGNVKARDLSRLLQELGERRSAHTANNVRGTLQSMFGAAVRWELIERNPINRQSVPALKVRRKGRFENFLRPEEARAFLVAVASHKTHCRRFALYTFLLETGCRFGEAAGLRISDLDLTRGRAFIFRSVRQGVESSTKGDDEREVTFSETLTEALRDHVKRLMREGVKNPKAVVFPNDAGDWLTPESLRWSLKVCLGDAGIDRRVTVHGLRHSFCTALALEGRSALEIAQRAGHAQASTSERYIHLAEAARRETPAIIRTMSDGLFEELKRRRGED